MRTLPLFSLVLLTAPLALTAQQPAAPAAIRPLAPHDSVRGAISVIDTRARTVAVTTGVGFAIRVVTLNVPADVPITDSTSGQGAALRLAQLRPGDVVLATFGGRTTGFVAYAIERLGRMDQGAERAP